MGTGTLWYEMWYYAHDHLYSPVFLAGYTGVPVERYEYDAYGNCQIMDAYYNPRATSNYNNPYLFTGRRLDILDNGALKLQYNRNRYYDCYTARWFTHDPMGYEDGMNLYEYVSSSPVYFTDPMGEKKRKWCQCFCPTGILLDDRNAKFLPDPPGDKPPWTKKTRLTNRLYATFNLYVFGEWVSWKKKGDGRPHLKWWEKWTEQPTIKWYKGTKPGEWWDMYEKSEGKSGVFDEFTKMKPPSPCALVNKDAFILHDEPGMERGAIVADFDQRVLFEIWVLPKAECPCKVKGLRIKFTYRADALRGFILGHWLKPGQV